MNFNRYVPMHVCMYTTLRTAGQKVYIYKMNSHFKGMIYNKCHEEIYHNISSPLHYCLLGWLNLRSTEEFTTRAAACACVVLQ